MIRGSIGAVLGGAVGAGIWAAVAHFAELEIGWIAWGTGALVGLGATMAAPEGSPAPMAFVAAGIALVSVLGGRYAAVSLAFGAEVARLQDGVADMDRELLVSYVADEVAAEREANGERLAWPSIDPDDVPDERADYPPAVWTDAEAIWQSMTPAEREEFQAAVGEHLSESARLFGAEARREGFVESFSPIDLLFLGLAVATAFKLTSGAGRASD